MNRWIRSTLTPLLSVIVFGCGGGGAPAPEPADLRAIAAQAGMRGTPLDNVSAESIDSPKAQLGKSLFFSKRLSLTGTVACVSCHHPLLGGADALSLPVGVGAEDPDILGPGRRYNPHLAADSQLGPGPNVPRNSPTTFNIALYNRTLFHDGRIFVVDPTEQSNGMGQAIRTPDSLGNLPDPEAGKNLTMAQAKFPLTSPHEMRGIYELAGATAETVRETVTTRLVSSDSNGAWLRAFNKAFGSGSPATVMTEKNIAEALSAYQRSQLFVSNPWFDFLKGNNSAISEQARKGARLFIDPPSKGGFGCAGCHTGDHFTDEKFHNIATPQIGIGKSSSGADFGRYDVTRDEKDRFAFRTPSLLNVAKTAPYGHAGAYKTLKEIVRHHLDPQASITSFSQNTLPQLTELGVSYSNSSSLTHQALNALNQAKASGVSLLPSVSATEEDVDALVTFLEALTDPCTESPNCMARWLPDEETSPDSSLLQARFGNFGSNVSTAVTTTRVVTTPTPGTAPQADPGDAPSCPITPATSRDNSSGKLFSDVSVSANANLPFTLSNTTWQTATPHLIETLILTGGSATADLNGDCLPDIIAVLGERVVRMMAKTDGTYQNTTLLNGLYSGPNMVDLDNDGDLDLFVSGLKNTNSVILRNDGTGSFSAWGESTGLESGLYNTFGAAFADIDRDGDLDAFIGHWDLSTPTVPNHLWLNDGTGHFSAADSSWGISTYYAGKGNDFSFTPNFVDINNDGWPDLLSTEDFGRSKVFINQNGLSFSNITNSNVITDENGMGAAIADYNGDGHPDWFVSSIIGVRGIVTNFGVTGNRLYTNDGTGHFTDTTDNAGVRNGGWGWGSCAADFNNDGLTDILQVNGYGDFPFSLLTNILPASFLAIFEELLQQFLDVPARLFIATAPGKFTESATSFGIDDDGEAKGISCFDADRDGDIDVFIVDHAGNTKLFRNNAVGQLGNNFMSFRLWQRDANVNALGATIAITAGGITQVKQIQHYNNYLSQNTLDAHFGLGTNTTASKVVVTWPDRTKSTYLNVPAGKILTIQKPSQ